MGEVRKEEQKLTVVRIQCAANGKLENRESWISSTSLPGKRFENWVLADITRRFSLFEDESLDACADKRSCACKLSASFHRFNRLSCLIASIA